jgi:3-deoxy-D-manno-octulosonate 8-phosphate phosphatase (KDO 8-P phosphatase)
MLLLDVDGVLTDGRLYYGPDGEPLKVFDVKDGIGLRLLAEEGVHIGVISARGGPAVQHRLGDLKITLQALDCETKVEGLADLCDAARVPEQEVAYVGDDLLDLPVLRRVGLPISVADGHPLVRAEVAWITRAPGGRGAVREVADGLLAARGRLEAARDRLLAEKGG